MHENINIFIKYNNSISKFTEKRKRKQKNGKKRAFNRRQVKKVCKCAVTI